MLAISKSGFVSVDDYCRHHYGDGWDATEQSRRSKRNAITKMCRNGTLTANKRGRFWDIWMEVPNGS